MSDPYYRPKREKKYFNGPPLKLATLHLLDGTRLVVKVEGMEEDQNSIVGELQNGCKFAVPATNLNYIVEML
jgi:hypothetical protein